jgi:hypothetical protein
MQGTEVPKVFRITLNRGELETMYALVGDWIDAIEDALQRPLEGEDTPSHRESLREELERAKILRATLKTHLV